MTAKSGSQAVANARTYSRYTPPGMCLQWVRLGAWKIGSLYPSAIDAWNAARFKHPGDRNPPLGAPVFYSGGKYGHIVVAVGNGRIRSTDCQSSGQVSEVPIDWPIAKWGQKYLGWTEDLNGVRLPLDTGGGKEEDDMNLNDSISQWSPDDGGTGNTTVGKTLNQARGYSEDTYERVKALEKKMDQVVNKLDKLLKK